MLNGKDDMETENKRYICELLCHALQETRGAQDLISLTYIPELEVVEAMFRGGRREINVAMDSGVAMIRDIVNNLGC